MPFRLNNSAYNAAQLCYFEKTDTIHYPVYQTCRRGILPRVGETWLVL